MGYFYPCISFLDELETPLGCMEELDKEELELELGLDVYLLVEFELHASFFFLCN